MVGGVKGVTRLQEVDPSVNTTEQRDEMLYLVRDKEGEITDAGVEEFAHLERMQATYLKLTLIGKDEDKPLVLILRSESKITIREK